MLKKLTASFIVFSLFLTLQAPLALTAQASVSSWQRGANINPTYAQDFASESFKQSLRNLKATGANAVSLVLPFYQGSIYDTGMWDGHNTPDDASLAAAIDYAHELGLSVTLKPHIEVSDGTWRAYINPGDRDAWFQNYGNKLAHWAQIAADHNVEAMVLGSELVSMAASSQNGTNTQNWQNLIGRIRSIFGGKLAYDANSNNNGDHPFVNEKKYIEFWGDLDYAGISGYYNLNTGSNDVESLKAQWDYWNNNDIRAFAERIGKPVVFSEIGYRSVEGAHQDPWNWGRGGNVDQHEQANAYEALFSYWNSYPYIGGVYLWNWETNPDAGGWSNGYTPQNKPAQEVMSRWFGTPQEPAAEISAAANEPVSSYDSSGYFNPDGPSPGTTAQLTVAVTNQHSTITRGEIVDIELYDMDNNKVFQQFFENQEFGANESRTYTADWNVASGTYRLKIGVFSDDWAALHHWNDDAATVTVE